MDTEGICNPEFMDEPWYNHHNNWLATLALLGSDVCCLLSNNEDDTMVRTVLPSAMLAHSNAEDTLSRAGFNKRHIYFVFNKVDPAAATECLQGNRLSMMRSLEEKRKELQDMSHSVGTRRDPFSLIGEGHFSYLGPDLNDTENYGENVVNLRQKIDETLGADINHRPVGIEHWWQMFSCLLDALSRQDFALSFKSIVEFKYEMVRVNFIGQKESEIQDMWHAAFAEVQNEMKQDFQRKGHLDDTSAGDWEAKIDHFKVNGLTIRVAAERATQAIGGFLKHTNHRDAQLKVETKWKNFI